MRILSSAAASFAWLASTCFANAVVRVAIDLTHQRMHVEAKKGTFDWPISSARSGFTTPGGSFAPTHLELMHHSKRYHMSPMPHAIFFRGGYAIHGTYSTSSLGRPASHGCVRLSPGNAASLYVMVQQEGGRISIGGSPPASRPFHEAAEHHRVRRRRDADAFAHPSNDTFVDRDNGTPFARRRAYRIRAAQGSYFLRQPQYDVYRPAYGYAPAKNASPQDDGGLFRQQGSLAPGFRE